MNPLARAIRDPLSLTADQLDPLLIATALSRANRWGGHGDFALSVAQHSWALSLCVPRRLAFPALIHDVPEIFIGEIPSPFKDTIPAIAAREEKIMRHLCALWGIRFAEILEVMPFDKTIRNDESWALFGQSDGPGLGADIQPMCADRARQLWLERFFDVLHVGDKDVA